MVRTRWICLALIAVNAVCFWQVCLDGFIELDDPAYVTDNAFIVRQVVGRTTSAKHSGALV